MLLTRGHPGKFGDGNLSGFSGVDAYLPAGVPAANLVLALDYKNQRYFKSGVAKFFADVQTFTRSGITWAWQLVGGNLELVEIADGVPPFSVDPATGHKIGLDTFPAITRRNPRYMPTAADMTTAGATVSNLAFNVLGHFAGLKINSAGSLTDEAITAAVDNTALTGGTRYSFDILLRDDGESTTVRFGLRGATSGNAALIEYTFATQAVTNPVITGGAFSSLVATVLVDGTHRITGDFIPTATESFGLLLQPKTTTAGAGFTLAAWFVSYASSQQRRTPPPVLGVEGATYATNRATNIGAVAVSGSRSVVLITRRITQWWAWKFEAQISGGGGSISFSNRQTESIASYIADGGGAFSTLNMSPITYGARTGVGIGYSDAIQQTASYDGINGLKFFTTSTAMTLPATDTFSVGSNIAGSDAMGNVTEGLFIFDVQLTQAQLEEIVQKVF